MMINNNYQQFIDIYRCGSGLQHITACNLELGCLWNSDQTSATWLALTSSVEVGCAICSLVLMKFHDFDEI